MKSTFKSDSAQIMFELWVKKIHLNPSKIHELPKTRIRAG
jgi:hypothetical protein